MWSLQYQDPKGGLDGWRGRQAADCIQKKIYVLLFGFNLRKTLLLVDRQ